jgi:predicted ATPase/DNA-binding CsgD family transcriptional regulator/Tfp pilus assembly protein PilF
MSARHPSARQTQVERQPPSLLSPLTKRELEILRLIADGADNREIAEQLFLTEGTVKWYVKQIYSKMGVSGRTKVVALARSLRLLDEPQPASIPPTTQPKHNLPAQGTRFIGRERDLARLRERMLREDARLITLVGPPGIGKTRLGLQMASHLTDVFDDGVWFVNLAPVRDATLVAGAIGQTLGLQEAGGTGLDETVQEYLSRKHLLLVLDNFEHLLAAAPLVADLLRAAPRLYVLVTSRAALALYDEVEYAVAPLSLPALSFPEPPAALTGYESVALFLQCVRKFRVDFSLDEANARAVAEICVRLDGLPLAIELAAVRVKMFTPQALLRRLDKPLRLLTEGAADLPPRQRMLHTAIQWSYDLLSEAEQILLARIGVFVGGWTLEACERVCAEGLPIQVLDGLTSLLNKSLVRQEETADGEPRFTLLEMIREFSLEKLAERGEMERVSRAHADYFQALAERAAKAWRTADQQRWFDRLESDLDNLRAALRGFHESPDGLEPELRTIGALGWLWFFYCHFVEGLYWSEVGLARSGDVAPRIRAEACMSGGYSAFGLGDIDKAAELQSAALSILPELSDPREIAHYRYCLAAVRRNQVEVIGEYEELCALARRMNDAWMMSNFPVNLGAALVDSGDLDRAQSVFEEGLSWAQKYGYGQEVGFYLENMAEVALMLGQFEQAKRLCQQYLEAQHRVRSPRLLASVLKHLGDIALDEARYSDAKSLLDEALELGRVINDSMTLLTVLSSQGALALKTGNLSEAGTLHREGLKHVVHMNNPKLVARALEHYVATLSAAGQRVKAVRLFAASDALRKTAQTPTPPIYQQRNEAILTDLHNAMDQQTFDTAWQEGSAMTWEDAITYALADG